MRISELCYRKGVRGEGEQKLCFKRGGSGDFEHGLAPFAPALPPLNNDLSLASKLAYIGTIFSSFNPFPSLPSIVTDDRKQFQCGKIVLNNKARPLFLEFN